MTVAVIPVQGLPMIQPGDDLAALVGDTIEAARVGLKAHDVVVVCQKVVSKAEGAVVRLEDVEPSAFAVHLTSRTEGGKDPRAFEVVLREAARIVRMDRGHVIVETRHGWVCANAGVDESNGLGPDIVTLLPRDADASAAALRARLVARFAVELAVVITDTFGRPWREGQVEFALGVAGMAPVDDLRGTRDMMGHELGVTVIGVADEIACAAGLAMRKAAGVAAVLVRGCELPAEPQDEAARGGRSMIRPREHDLFR